MLKQMTWKQRSNFLTIPVQIWSDPHTIKTLYSTLESIFKVPISLGVKEVGFCYQIISFSFMILLDYLSLKWLAWRKWIHSSLHYQLCSHMAMLAGSSNIMLCQYLHQVTACSLDLLRKEAYEQYSYNSNLMEADWVISCEESYWNQTSNIQLVLLQFGKAVCSGDFQAYLTVLTAISP